MNKLIGRFYFIKTSNGNLIGEFSNNLANRIFTEGANLEGTSDGFIGDYITTWITGNNPESAKLTIRYKANTNDRIFTLNWTSNNQSYVGEGMLCEDKLIGDYRMI